MSHFIIATDGMVSVRSGSDAYYDTLANFATDYGQAAPSLPAGATAQHYEPGVRHFYGDGSNVLAGGDMPWTFGDEVIADVAVIAAAKIARLGIEPPPAELEPGTYPPREVASALQINVAGGDIPSMNGVFNIGAALYVDVGMYMLWFINPLTSADYFPLIQDGATKFEIIDQQPEYLIVQATDGIDPVDVSKFSLRVYQF